MNIDTSLTDEELSRLVCEALGEDYDDVTDLLNYATDWAILGPVAERYLVTARPYVDTGNWFAKTKNGRSLPYFAESNMRRALCWGILAALENENAES